MPPVGVSPASAAGDNTLVLALCHDGGVSLPARLAVAAVLAGAALTSAGCGGDDGSLSQAQDYARSPVRTIAADARTAMRDLRFMHVAGQVRQGRTTVTVDLSVSGKGECTGTIGVGAGSIELRSAGGRAWYRADAAFWRAEAPGQAATIERRVGGRWVPLTGQLASLRTFCSIHTLTKRMLDRSATVTSSGATMLGTRPTVRLAVERGGTTTTAYVVASEPHYVLRMTRGRQGDLIFSDFDQPFSVTSPAPSDVFDLGKIK